MRCAIWYHFYNLKNVKSTHGGVLILVKLLKLTLLHGYFSRFLSCTNGKKSRNAPHLKRSPCKSKLCSKPIVLRPLKRQKHEESK